MKGRVHNVRNGLIGLALALLIATTAQAYGGKLMFCELTECPSCYAYANCSFCYTTGSGCDASIEGFDCWDYDCECTGGGTLCECDPPCPGGQIILGND
jgi:hypothetical protein